MSIKLTVGYSVLMERLQDINALPEHPDWETVVVVQNPKKFSWKLDDFAALKNRSDLSGEELKHRCRKK